MNSLLKRLSDGELRSDGSANEVAEEVIKNPDLLDFLLEGLSSSDDVVRARVAHALEILGDEKKGIPPNWIKARK